MIPNSSVSWEHEKDYVHDNLKKEKEKTSDLSLCEKREVK